MAVIGSLWWVWLLAMLIFGVYAALNQLKRMKGMMKDGLSGNIDDSFKSFFSGIIPLLLSTAISGACAVLLAISIIINLFHYLKG
jgi:hypothetical protein